MGCGTTRGIRHGDQVGYDQFDHLGQCRCELPARGGCGDCGTVRCTSEVRYSSRAMHATSSLLIDNSQITIQWGWSDVLVSVGMSSLQTATVIPYCWTVAWCPCSGLGRQLRQYVRALCRSGRNPGDVARHKAPYIRHRTVRNTKERHSVGKAVSGPIIPRDAPGNTGTLAPSVAFMYAAG